MSLEGTFSNDAAGNLTLTLNRGAGALNVGPTALTAAKAIADGSGNNIASTYATQSALSSGLAGKADAGTEITGGAFSDGTLILNREAGEISIDGFLSNQGPILKNFTGDIESHYSSSRGGYLNFQIQWDVAYISETLSGYFSAYDSKYGEGGTYVESVCVIDNSQLMSGKFTKDYVSFSRSYTATASWLRISNGEVYNLTNLVSDTIYD